MAIIILVVFFDVRTVSLFVVVVAVFVPVVVVDGFIVFVVVAIILVVIMPVFMISVVIDVVFVSFLMILASRTLLALVLPSFPSPCCPGRGVCRAIGFIEDLIALISVVAVSDVDIFLVEIIFFRRL